MDLAQLIQLCEEEKCEERQLEGYIVLQHLLNDIQRNNSRSGRKGDWRGRHRAGSRATLKLLSAGRAAPEAGLKPNS
jgi:hypothetical protein